MNLSDIVAAAPPAFHTSFEQLLAVGLPFALGLLVSWVTAAVTKENLPSPWKALVNTLLAIVAGAVTNTVFPIATGDVRTEVIAYFLAIGLAIVTSTVTYLTGASNWVVKHTWRFGLGYKVPAPEDIGYMGRYIDDDQSGQPE